ncbi:hypothetical protein G3N18_02190 [Microbacterium sp. 2C]|uniref:hypothetical protein n=1 Tax=Microbacterium TaxID=33882 RepID=UPI0018C2703F|nr:MULTISPECIES: hypothetical protein [Microbacterium]MBG0716898.1 hypothetical protein [Microbacterium paulum]
MSATPPGEMMVGMSIPRFASAAPDGVVVYPNPFVFLAEDPRREATNGVTGDLGGWDVADGFRLSEGIGDSEWRISVLHGEVYAVLRRFPGQREYSFDGPVWMIAEIPPALRDPVLRSLVPHESVQELMAEVERLRAAPDSLLTAVEVIRSGLRALAAGS